jgi:hypothetical protein
MERTMKKTKKTPARQVASSVESRALHAAEKLIALVQNNPLAGHVDVWTARARDLLDVAGRARDVREPRSSIGSIGSYATPLRRARKAS